MNSFLREVDGCSEILGREHERLTERSEAVRSWEVVTTAHLLRDKSYSP